ncbi:hypothetical protein SAMN04490188_3895 [Pseudomonas kilonensis]|uniref:Uncharacterized protein n=1 Tax=Pseudomonas kilonensis TaxID=132476 RepID=A0ABY0Z9D5_9PSED|nr:hypothetical protein SAMN04490188_3895 [Pseudomonas kilonensis]
MFALNSLRSYRLSTKLALFHITITSNISSHLLFVFCHYCPKKPATGQRKATTHIARGLAAMLFPRAKEATIISGTAGPTIEKKRSKPERPFLLAISDMRTQRMTNTISQCIGSI